MILGRSKKGFIIDTWSKGKSNSETDQHYSQWRKVTRSIGNMSHVSNILDSFSKLIDGKKLPTIRIEMEFPDFLRNMKNCIPICVGLSSL